MKTLAIIAVSAFVAHDFIHPPITKAIKGIDSLNDLTKDLDPKTQKLISGAGVGIVTAGTYYLINKFV